MPVFRQLLRPVKLRLIVLTFLGAFLLNSIPWPGPVSVLLPDFLALSMLYWVVSQPQRVGMSTAFFLGICMDVGYGTLLGQHAIAYVLITYLGLSTQRVVAIFPFWQQALWVGGLLLLSQIVMLVVRMLMGAPFIGWDYFIAPVLACFLWAPLSNLLLFYQRTSTSEQA